MEKQAAWAAAISSSGLVRPPAVSVREDQVIGRSPIAPLPVVSIRPEPSSRLPLQLARAVDSMLIIGPPIGVAVCLAGHPEQIVGNSSAAPPGVENYGSTKPRRPRR